DAPTSPARGRSCRAPCQGPRAPWWVPGWRAWGRRWAGAAPPGRASSLLVGTIRRALFARAPALVLRRAVAVVGGDVVLDPEIGFLAVQVGRGWRDAGGGLVHGRSFQPRDADAGRPGLPARPAAAAGRTPAPRAIASGWGRRRRPAKPAAPARPDGWAR